MLALCIGLWLAASANAAGDITLSASVNTTRTVVGEPIELTLSLQGEELEGLELQPLKLPPAWVSRSQRQTQQVTWQQGRVSRRLDAIFLLVPRATGAFQLGPFTVERRGQRWQTEPITISVEAAPTAPPPTLERPPSGRITL